MSTELLLLLADPLLLLAEAVPNLLLAGRAALRRRTDLRLLLAIADQLR